MGFNTIVTLPVNIITDEDSNQTKFVRPSEDGNITCYVNPREEIRFQYLDPGQQMLGGVTAYTSNNPDNGERLLTDVMEPLTPNNFYFKNGLVCLNVVDKGVEYYYWDPVTTDYIYMNTFDIDPITHVSARVINSNVVQVQINDTIWTLRRGRPFVYVQHANTLINYDLRDFYVHDGATLVGPTVGTSFTMQSIDVCNVYNGNNLFPLQVATGTDYQVNLLTQNQSNCGEDGTNNGFGANGGCSLSDITSVTSSTTTPYSGSRCIKVTTHSGANDGIATIPGASVNSGQTYTASAWVKGSGTIQIAISERDSNDNNINEYKGTAVTLTSSWQLISLTYVITTGVKAKIKVYTSAAQTITFYVDQLQLNLGTSTSWVVGEDVSYFTSVNNGILTSSTDWSINGSKSLKIVSPGVNPAEGANMRFTSIPGMNYTVQVSLKGVAGQTYRIYLRQNASPYTSFFQDIYQVVTASGGTDVFTFTGTCSDSVTLGSVIVGTNTARAETFYIDNLVVVRGDSVAPGTMDMTTGDITEKYRMLIVKTAPTSINTDSLPPDAITIIGHYSKDATGFDTANSIASECFMQVMEYIKPYKV